MKKTEQTKGMSVLQHGFMVKNYTFDLINFLKTNQSKYDWSRLPKVVLDNKDIILNNLLSNDIIKEYTVLHDISKPYCLEIDDLGKRHFPNHAEKSHEIYKTISDNEDVAYLILHDMDLHLGVDFTPNEKYIYTQILVSVAELFSNAQMFGGTENVSFKIKLKKLEKTIKKNNKNK